MFEGFICFLIELFVTTLDLKPPRRDLKPVTERFRGIILVIRDSISESYLISSIQQGKKLIFYTGAQIEGFLGPEND